MKKKFTASFHERRTLLTLFAAPMVSACAGGARDATANLSEEDQRLRQKFRGISGGVLRVDAVGYPKQYVSITTNTGGRLSGAGELRLGTGGTSAFVGGPTIVPKTVRATWKKNDPPITRDASGNWNGGTIIGDYTVPVAERIPDEMLDYIRKNGGALRLKIRLHDEGIFIGWDVEIDLPTAHDWRMAGGDFHEAQIFNGRIVKHAWYLDKRGEKVFTDENPYAPDFDPNRPLRILRGVRE